ncbi:Hypothetical protein CINCED_3A006169 [Cinara cedri]|uniref:Uncharacterized protein n=1 Tax=Cinara cedri TaxID=506608 RepID=A0A5E4NBE8_9HEMI|nr:Hypothetical protein CINCED_3A006169 [Cinara cedri]
MSDPSDQSEEQSSNKDRTSDSEKTDDDVSFKDRMKKKMSKTQSKSTKSKSRIMNVKKKKSDTNADGGAAEIADLIEAIVVANVSLVDLKEGYYSDLRYLVPPPEQNKNHLECQGIVNRKLREMHDAIDEINRTLDAVNLSVFECNRLPSEVSESPTVSDLAKCAKMPLRGRLLKPDTGITMKTYRHKKKK